MIPRKSLISIPFHDWKVIEQDGFNTRDSHILESWIKGEEFFSFLVVNRPTSIFEFILGRKNCKSKGEVILKTRNYFLIKVESKDNVYVIDSIDFNIFDILKSRFNWFSKVYQNKHLTDFLNQSIHFLKIEDYIVYTSSPFSIPLIRRAKLELGIFDAVDNFLKYKIYKKIYGNLKDFYNYALSNAKVFVVNSKDSQNYFLKGRNDIHLLPNGVSLEIFEKKYDVPEDLAKLKRPIVGYAGKIQRMFDTDIFCKLANEYPDISFVLIGRFLNENLKNQILSSNNVHFLGFKNYQSYPAYLTNFDICIIPYLIENQHGGDPIKFYEYYASQKRIVSTNIGEIGGFHDSQNVFIANDSSQFEKYFRLALNEKQMVNNDLDKLELQSWESISKKFIYLLLNKI